MSLMIAFTLAFFHIGSYYFVFRREFQPPESRMSKHNRNLARLALYKCHFPPERIDPPGFMDRKAPFMIL
jgi:hypothetical protein